MTVCARCNKEIDELSGDQASTVIGYSICRSCKDDALCGTGVELHKYIDSLPVPVILINPEKGVKTANDKACTMLNKRLNDIEGYPGGIVFECKYAGLPGGCGHTEHCSGCTIRNTITETFITGKGFYKTPALLNRDDKEVNLLISTEKIGDFVFLRIDEAK